MTVTAEPHIVAAAGLPAEVIAPLFEACFGQPFDASWWRWKYRAPRNPSLALVEDGRAMAHYGGMPRAVSMFGARVAGLQVGDVVATRFHNVLLALRLGIPVQSIAYEGKNDALMQSMGLGAYCQSIDSLDLARLLQQVERLELEAPALEPRIAQRAQELQARLELQYAQLFGAGASAAAHSGEQAERERVDAPRPSAPAANG